MLGNIYAKDVLQIKKPKIGLLNIGEYYTLVATYGDVDKSSQYVHFKLQPATATTPSVNDFDFHHGMNSRYGFVLDNLGNPMIDVVVTNGQQTVVTNSDGFYLLQNLAVGSQQTYTFT